MKAGDTGSEHKRQERKQSAHRLSTQGLINNRPQVNTEEMESKTGHMRTELQNKTTTKTITLLWFDLILVLNGRKTDY